MIPEYLYKWAQLKGITVVGTGDFTHPGWTQELQQKCEPAEQGLFKLKKEYSDSEELNIFNSCKRDVRFILTAEISCIYKKNDKVRKVHNLIFAPDFEAVNKIQTSLSKIGNITSDGRPILGLDAKDLLDIVLNVSDDCFLIPAHIWTPWFSTLGSKSGFDTIDQCFEDLTPHIFAIETGLSSDPAMNWMCSFLDKFTIISNSDAHSPEKLGREANIFDTDLSYNAIKNAMKQGNKDEFLGTIEFFPQEGKYHYDGHRKCGICWNPVESVKNNYICPVCGKKVTLGVMYRVAELADREDINEHPNRYPFHSLIPLKEILSEILNVGTNSKKVQLSYQNLLNKYGSEFDILLNLPYDAFENKEDFLLAEGIKRMREARVIIEEGYDGEYGKIKVFEQNEARDWFQKDLFCMGDNKLTSNRNKRVESGIDIKEFKHLKSAKDAGLFSDVESTVKEDGLNESQLKAVKYLHGSSLIIAGPGTGKTRTLTYKILELINSNINPENILALTFSNHAAKEIFERVKNMLHDKDIVDKKIISKLSVSTFHSFGLSIIDENIELTGRKKKYFIINTRDKEILFKNFLNIKQSEMKKYIQDISNIKQQLIKINDVQDEDLKKVYLKYNEVLIENNLFDFDDLLYLPLYIFIKHPDILKCYQNRYKWINIDEYQDINYAQYSLVRILAPEKSSNITVIGDPNQAIYGFRGADVKYIQEFKNDYPETLIFQLDTSYRCSSNILNASQQIINQSQDKLFYLKGMEQGLKIKIKEYSTDKTEAEFVARQIESMMGGLRFFSMDSGISDGQENADVLGLSDFAVLCRIGQQMRCIEKAFIDHSIPYQKIGETPFYNNQPFSSIIDLIKLIVSFEYFLKVINIGIPLFIK